MLGIAMIVRNEERDLPKCLESIQDIAGHIVIVDTGSTDNTKQVIKDFCLKTERLFYHLCPNKFTLPITGRCVFYFRYLEASSQVNGEWLLDDFAKARNVAIDAIESLVDWIMWLDADDRLIDPKKVLNLLKKEAVYDFMVVADPSNTTGHYHKRLWPSKYGIRFAGAVHEVPILTAGVPCENSGMKVYHDYTPHPEGSGEPANLRNLRIHKKEYESGNYTLRTVFYLGNSYMYTDNYPEAIKMYDEYLQKGGNFHEEIIFAHVYKARCLRLQKKYNACLAEALTGIAKDDKFSELYMEASYAAYCLKQYELSISYAKLALRPVPARTLFPESNKYTDQPWRQISWAEETLGNTNAAILATKEILKVVPHDGDMLARLTNLMTRPVVKQKEAHFCRPGAAGDVLCCLTALQWYKMLHPKTRIVFHTNAMYRDMVARCPIIDEIKTDVTPECIQLIGYRRADGYPNQPLQKNIIHYFMDEIGLENYPIMPLEMFLPANVFGEYVTVHTTPGWSPYKAWDNNKWQLLMCKLIEAGVKVIQLGGGNEYPLLGAVNMLGKTSLVDALGIVSHAKLHIGVDSVFNHATNVNKQVPGVILYGSTSPCTGYEKNVNMWKKLDCSPCYREYPNMTIDPKPACPHSPVWENPKHPCMDFSVEEVWDHIVFQLKLYPSL
jgi:glycosyltransferase involved in cell wall biosynthesis